MKWAIYLKTDAVLTNDPEKYLALRSRVLTEQDHPESWPWREFITLYLWSWLGFIFMSLRVLGFSKRGGWKEKLGNVEAKVIKGGVSGKVQEIHD